MAAPDPQTHFAADRGAGAARRVEKHALTKELATEESIGHPSGVSRDVAWKTWLLASAANEAAAAGEEFETQSQLAGGLG
jgi:hypothetical protein